MQIDFSTKIPELPGELVAAAHEPPPGHPVPRALDLVRLHARAQLEPAIGHGVL